VVGVLCKDASSVLDGFMDMVDIAIPEDVADSKDMERMVELPLTVDPMSDVAVVLEVFEKGPELIIVVFENEVMIVVAAVELASVVDIIELFTAMVELVKVGSTVWEYSMVVLATVLVASGSEGGAGPHHHGLGGGPHRPHGGRPPPKGPLPGLKGPRKLPGGHRPPPKRPRPPPKKLPGNWARAVVARVRTVKKRSRILVSAVDLANYQMAQQKAGRKQTVDYRAL
jgi:hypothetical protein